MNGRISGRRGRNIAHGIRSARQRGYTLLETLVAFVILVGALGTLYESYSLSLQRSSTSRNTERANLFAASLYDRLGVELAVRTPNQGSVGDCHWQYAPEPEPTADRLPRSTTDTPADARPDTSLVLMRLSVDCGAAGVRGHCVLHAMLLAPT